MQKINLRDLYPDIYKTDIFLEVTDEVHAVFLADKRADAAYERQMYRYKAYYSLDHDNGIENAVISPTYPGGNLGGQTSTGTALRCGDGVAGQAGQADLCPVLPGHDAN